MLRARVGPCPFMRLPVPRSIARPERISVLGKLCLRTGHPAGDALYRCRFGKGSRTISMISSRSSIVPSSGLCIFASWIFGKCDLPCYCRIDAVTILGDGATAAHWIEVGVQVFEKKP